MGTPETTTTDASGSHTLCRENHAGNAETDGGFLYVLAPHKAYNRHILTHFMVGKYWSRLPIGLLTLIILAGGCMGIPPSDPTATSLADPTESAPATVPEISDHLSVHEELTPNHTYHAENNTIEYIEEYRTSVNETTGEVTREPVYGTAPADTWLKHRGASIAARAVRQELTTNASGQTLDGITVAAASEPTTHVSVVWTRTKVGDTTQTPRLPQETLRENVPEDVTVTLSAGEKQMTRTYNVTVNERTKL